MAIRPLKELDDYELTHSGQDCRGWPVIDATGNRVGMVSEMLVDTETERVTSLVLDRGDTIPVGAVSLEDGKVHARTLGAGAKAPAARQDAAREGTHTEAGKEVVVPVVEEEIRIGKREVPGSGARVSTKVEERPVHEKVTLREEKVYVERHPADRAVAHEGEAFQERSIDVPAKSEEPVVEKRARVVGEVIVGKETKEREVVVDDKLKRTDVEVKNQDKDTGKGRSPRSS